MPEVSPAAQLLGRLLYEFENVKPFIPMYLHLILSALLPIIAGSHASLSRPSSAAKAPKGSKEKDADGTDDEDYEDETGISPIQKMEGLQPSDAVMLPLTAGLTLGGLYLVIKWLGDPAILNKILNFYFSQMGFFFGAAFIKDAFSIILSFVFPKKYQRGGNAWLVKQSNRIFTAENGAGVCHSPLPGVFGRIPLPESLLQGLWNWRGFLYQPLRFHAHIRGLFDFKSLFGLLDIVSGVASLVAVGYFAFIDKPWWLTNFLGFSFCYGSLQFMSPTAFTTGALILGALFLYDIYFVFYTPLMVTVATKLDVPIKLMIPRPPRPDEKPDTVSLAMLGLGDIVIPGMMIGLALRFDLYLYYKRKGIQKARAEGKGNTFVKPRYQAATGSWGEKFWARSTPPGKLELEPPYHDARSFPKPYFTASLIGYIAGMITTLGIMQVFGHAQPALLYLVPGVVGSLFGTALFKGDLGEMVAFSDTDETDDDDEKKKEEQKGKDEQPEKKTTKGLFLRLLSGDASVFGLDEKDEKKSKEGDGAEDKQSDKNKKEKGTTKDGETNEDSDLVVFSISFPRKKSQQTERAGSTGSEADKVEQSIPSWTDNQGKEEPPGKRRRTSVGEENSENS